MPDYITGVLLWLSAKLVVYPIPSSKLWHLFLSLAVFFDDCRFFLTSPGAWGGLTWWCSWLVPRPCTLPVLLSLPLPLPLPLPTRPPLLPLFSQVFSPLASRSQCCLTRVSNVYRRCLILPDSVGNMIFNFRINTRTANIVIIVVNVRCYRLILHSRSQRSFAEL